MDVLLNTVNRDMRLVAGEVCLPAGSSYQVTLLLHHSDVYQTLWLLDMELDESIGAYSVGLGLLIEIDERMTFGRVSDILQFVCN